MFVTVVVKEMTRREFTTPETKLEIAVDHEGRPLTIKERIINVLLATRTGMSIDEIFKAVVRDGHCEIKKNSLGEEVRLQSQQGVINRLRHGYYVHADFYLEAQAAGLHKTMEERILDILKLNSAAMNLEQITIAISRDSLAPTTKGALKQRLLHMMIKQVIKRLSVGYYIHADFYIEGVESSRHGKQARALSPTRHNIDYVETLGQSTDNQEVWFPQPTPHGRADEVSQSLKSTYPKLRRPTLLRRADAIIDAFKCQINLSQLTEELRKEGYGELLDSETFRKQAEIKIRRKQTALARRNQPSA